MTHCLNTPERIENSPTASISNRFALLHLEATRSQLDAPRSREAPCDSVEETDSGYLKQSNSSLIQDDELSDAIEIAVALDEIAAIKSSVVSVWVQAGKIGLPISIPACVTNHAVNQLQDIEARLCCDEDKLDLGAAHKKLHLLDRLSGSAEKESHSHETLNQLLECWDIVQHHIKSDDTPCDHHDPSERTVRVVNVNVHDPAARLPLINSLMKNITQVFTGSGATKEQVQRNYGAFRFFAGLEAVDDHTAEKRSSQLQMSFSLCILCDSYLAYLQYHPVNPRVAALHYATCILDSLTCLLHSQPPTSESTFPCRCPDTLAFHLEHLRNEVKQYIRTPSWTLLDQAPWLAGSQILDLIHRTSYFGFQLLHYRNFVGAVVHLYNALATSGILHEPIQILERLCTYMTSFFFPGGTGPQKNFFKAYVRFLGGRLKFHKAASHRDSWCMAIPSHAARASSGLGSGLKNAKKDGASNSTRKDANSLLVKLVQNEYRLDEPTSTQLEREMLHVTNTKTSEREEYDKLGGHHLRAGHRCSKTCHHCSEHRGDYLKCLQRSLAAEWCGTLPQPGEEDEALSHSFSSADPSTLHPARLDFFSLYSSYVTMVERVCQLHHMAQQEAQERSRRNARQHTAITSTSSLMGTITTADPEACHRCLCFMESTLAELEGAYIDKRVKRRRRQHNDGGEQISRPESAKIVLQAMKDVFGGDDAGNLRKWTWAKPPG